MISLKQQRVNQLEGKTITKPERYNCIFNLIIGMGL
jgi:hypothetical protein